MVDRPRRTPLQLLIRELRRNPSAMIGAAVVLLLVLAAVFADLLAPYDPLIPDPLASLKPPHLEHPLGTDPLGRDQLSRILHGTRISLRLGLISTSIAALAGTFLGLMAGYYRKWAENIIMSLMDVLLAFPSILLALAIVYALGINLTNLMVAVGISAIPGYTRLVRGTVLGIKATPYIEAARVIGCPDGRIIFRHILPNAVAPIIVLATMGVASAILSASALSFLGLGTKPPTPEWGVMLSEGRSFMAIAPWLTTYPGLAIMATVLAMNLLGNGLRDALDPRLRSR
jgi:ABC-type dipeptide/oligopeptide/nickel transport system permease subunit